MPEGFFDPDFVPDTWPERNSAPGTFLHNVNVWFPFASALMAKIERRPSMWLNDGRLKYLDFRVDTRSGHFVLKDRDHNRSVHPNEVLKALREARDKYSEVDRKRAVENGHQV